MLMNDINVNIKNNILIRKNKFKILDWSISIKKNNYVNDDINTNTNININDLKSKSEFKIINFNLIKNFHRLRFYSKKNLIINYPIINIKYLDYNQKNNTNYKSLSYNGEILENTILYKNIFDYEKYLFSNSYQYLLKNVDKLGNRFNKYIIDKSYKLNYFPKNTEIHYNKNNIDELVKIIIDIKFNPSNFDKKKISIHFSNSFTKNLLDKLINNVNNIKDFFVKELEFEEDFEFKSLNYNNLSIFLNEFVISKKEWFLYKIHNYIDLNIKPCMKIKSINYDIYEEYKTIFSYIDYSIGKIVVK